jgi:UrcA family protein
MKSRINYACIAAVGVCMLAGTGARAAGVPGDSQAISLAGFDLASAADVRTLGYRIKRAATALCGPIGESRADRAAYWSCKRGAEADAMAQLDGFVAAAKTKNAALVASR